MLTRLTRQPLRRAVALSLVATALAISACGGDDQPAKKGDGPAPSSSAPPEPVHHPFTGALIEKVPTHGALVVKVDNTDAARTQQGLDQADLVVEELVEGGLTRLAAIFYDTLPPKVGPVRSMRTSDIAIVKPTGGVLAASGAARKPTAAIKAAGIPTIEPGQPGFSRDSSRNAPYNLFLDARTVEKQLADREVPGPYLSWAKPDAAAPQGRPATKATVRFSSFHTTSWTFRGKRWARQEELAGSKAFKVTNLLVLSVRLRDAGYRDVAGNPVPETVLRGTGQAWLFRDGQVVAAKWTKGRPEQPISLTTAAGAPLPVPVGNTWIELVPTTGTVTPGR